MKYYIYISDAKVDMLIQQIPRDVKKKIATEFKFDLKILSTSRKTEVEESEGQISRLEAVCEFIRQYGNVGTVENPDEYISDTLNMNWNTYGIEGSDRSRLVYFSGIEDRNVIGLAGSAIHLIGPPTPKQELTFSGDGSSLPRIVGFLQTVTESGLPVEWAGKSRWIDLTLATSLTSKGPKQRLEFLAKRLVGEVYRYKHDQRGYVTGLTKKQNGEWNVTLGTPLYVAMAK